MLVGRSLIVAGAALTLVAVSLSVPRRPRPDEPAGSERTVATNAALKALRGGSAAVVYRAGFAAAGDGGGASYAWSASDCTLQRGAGDNGAEVAPDSGGGCWKLIVPTIADARIWGCKEDGTTDDTACWRALDAAWATMPRPPQYVFLAGTSAVAMDRRGAAGCLAHVARISGDLGSSRFVIAPSVSAEPVCYSGGGPFELDHVIVEMPVPDWSARAVSGVYSILVTGGAPIPHPVSGIRIHDNVVIGGNVGIELQSVAKAEIYRNQIEQTGGDGIAVDSASDRETTTTSDISVHDNACRITGHYCISLANLDRVAAAPRRLYIYNNAAVGSGILADKGCYDLTASAYDYLVADNSGADCAVGGGEAKLTYDRGIAAVPDIERGGFVKMRYLTHFDAGTGFDINTEMPTAASADAHTQFFVGVEAAYAPAPPWQSGWLYQLGDTVTSNGKVFLAVAAGISGKGPGPDGTGVVVDDAGGLTWRFMALAPSAQGAAAATAPGGETGRGYAAGDALRVASPACPVSPVLQPTLLQSGAILGYRVAFEGECAAAPADPVALTGGSGTGARARLTLLPIPRAFTGAWVEAVSNTQLTVHVERARDGVLLMPVGSADQTLRHSIIAIDGTVQDRCLTDAVPNERWLDTARIVQNAVVADVTVLPHCTALGQNHGAIQIGATAPIPPWEAGKLYFRNALARNRGRNYMAQCANTAGCRSAAFGGPAGIGSAIPDGADGLTWIDYTARGVAAIDYRNLRIDGGYLVNEGLLGDTYAFYESGSVGSLSGEISDTRMVSGTGGIEIREPTTLTIDGGSSLRILGDPAGLLHSAPIEASGVAATGAVALGGMVEVVAPTTFPAWRNVGGAAITVDGLMIRGSESQPPTAPCNYGETWLNRRPSASVPFGWTCTSPSATASVRNFTGH